MTTNGDVVVPPPHDAPTRQTVEAQHWETSAPTSEDQAVGNRGGLILLPQGRGLFTTPSSSSLHNAIVFAA